MKRIVFHIGYPKTGTSSLQGFFLRNMALLRDAGINYPDPSPLTAHHALAVRMCARRNPAERQAAVEEAAQIVRASPQDTVLLSSESFINLGEMPELVATLLRQMADVSCQVEFVVFVRAQHDFINSAYAQRTKTFGNSLKFASFLEGFIDRLRLDYVKLSTSLDVEGARFTPLPFTRERLQGGLERVFLETIGNSLDLAQAQKVYANSSPGPVTVEVARRISAAHSGATDAGLPQGIRPRATKWLSRLVKENGLDEVAFTALTPARVGKIRDRFAEGNEVFARRYWNAPWAEVFAADYNRNFLPNNLDENLDSTDLQESVRYFVDSYFQKFGGAA